MKRFPVLLLALAMLLSVFAGCAPDMPPADTDPVDTAETTPAEPIANSEDGTIVPSETTKAQETAKTPETTAPPEPAEPEPEKAREPVELTLPQYYETRTVQPTSVTPAIDGNLTTKEWGTAPDFCLSYSVTNNKRTYCCDYYAGGSMHIPEIEYYWRYDDEYVYVAMKLREPDDYVTTAPLTREGIDRVLILSIGGAMYRIVPDGENVVSAVGNMCCAYSYKNGAQYYEFAARREDVVGLVNGKTAFLGFAEFQVGISYIRHDDLPYTRSTITTRTTPIFENEKFTQDLFVLEEGKPAPAPALAITVKTPDPIGTVVMDGFQLEFGDPVVVDQGPVGDQIWGHFQFPTLTRYTDGSIRASWSYGRDTIEYKSEKNPNGASHAVSKDNGETWTLGGAVSGGPDKNLMHNGKHFAGFAGKGAYKTDYLDKYEPAYTWSSYKMFFAEDINETVDKTVTGYEYDPVTGKTTSFTCTINWPYMPLVQFPDNMVYPVTQMFALSSRAIVAVDGDLYLPLYFNGFDSTAKTRAGAVNEYCSSYSIFFFKSTDNGRTWDFVSQIMTDDKIKGSSEGLCEPEMTVTPDGSFVMLMRTGSNNPCYITRSEDQGKTWSTPERFDRIGVLPQLLTLECGVTLASYGRPTMRFAATNDPSGETWSEPIDIPVTGGAGQSCFYTDLLAIDEDTALFIYSDFMYPNENGQPVKTILVRTVTVIPD